MWRKKTETNRLRHEPTSTGKPVDSPAQVLFASLIGTKIECFDFFARFTPISAVLAERGRRRVLI